MPQCMGQCGRTWWKLHFSRSGCPPQPASDHKYCQSVFSRKAGRGVQKWSGRQASRDPPAIGHIIVTSCESSSPSSPCWAQEQGNPEHRPPRSHGFSRTFANQRIMVTWQVSERHYPRVGSSFRRRKTNCTFYILHYMWLCTICWYPDDGVHVWNIWYLAFSRRHEMKCIIHRVTSVFATVVTKPTVVSSSHRQFGFPVRVHTQHGFDLILACWSAHTCQCQDSQWTNSTSSYGLCYWFSSYSLRAIKWK